MLKNIHENSLSNVIPLHIASWNKKKKLKLFVHERPCHSLKIKGKDFIIVKRLPVTFIKIDVEGAEVEVIERKFGENKKNGYSIKSIDKSIVLQRLFKFWKLK